MSEDLIRYDILTQEALRSMIAKLLDEVSRTGLPGEHHFFITFDTSAPKVKISNRMKERYPEEMTIVIQHRFWDLEVKDDYFQIGLSFHEIPETLVVPFASIKGFYDPSVKFGLQFEVQVDSEQEKEIIGLTTVEAAKDDGGKKESKPELFEELLESDVAGSDIVENDAKEENSEPSGAEVVSLDSFRKKNK